MDQISQKLTKTAIKPQLDDDVWLLIANYFYKPVSNVPQKANLASKLVPSVDLLNLGKVNKRMWSVIAPLIWFDLEIWIDAAEDDFDEQYAKMQGESGKKYLQHVKMLQITVSGRRMTSVQAIKLGSAILQMINLRRLEWQYDTEDNKDANIPAKLLEVAVVQSSFAELSLMSSASFDLATLSALPQMRKLLFHNLSDISMATLTSLIRAHRLTLDTLCLSNIKLIGQEKLLDGCAGLELPALERLDLATVYSSELNWLNANSLLTFARPLRYFFLDAGTLAVDESFFPALGRNCSTSLRKLCFSTYAQPHDIWSSIASFLSSLTSLEKLTLHEEAGRRQRLFPIFDVVEMINAVVSCAKTLRSVDWEAWGRLQPRELKFLTSRLVNVVHFRMDVDYTMISWAECISSLYLKSAETITIVLCLPQMFSSGDGMISWNVLHEKGSPMEIRQLRSRNPKIASLVFIDLPGPTHDLPSQALLMNARMPYWMQAKAYQFKRNAEGTRRVVVEMLPDLVRQ